MVVCGAMAGRKEQERVIGSQPAAVMALPNLMR
jgi:hypothetical protein